MIQKAYLENPETIANVNLLSVYIWKYQGADEDMDFGEFSRGFIEGRFAKQDLITKASKIVLSQTAPLEAQRNSKCRPPL